MKKLPIYICLFLVVLSLCVPVSAAGLLTGPTTLSLSADSYPDLHFSGLPIEAQNRPFVLITNYTIEHPTTEASRTYDAFFVYAPAGKSMVIGNTSSGVLSIRGIGLEELAFVNGTWITPEWERASYSLDYDPSISRAVFSIELDVPDTLVYSYGSLYPVESDGVFSIFASVGGLLPRVFSSLIPIFWNEGLTAIGVLAISALGISVIALVAFLISKWLRFGG